MSYQHRFGGQWTEEKLECLSKYLKAYLTIFERNERARFFKTTYVDAFAGTGTRSERQAVAVPSDSKLFDTQPDDKEAEAYRKGSATIALEQIPGFKNYLFIERNPLHADELRKLVSTFPDKAQISNVVEGDAVISLQKWIDEVDWRTNRAVVFLDPYGMQVDWPLIEAIAATQAIDLWLLFPLGAAVNRLLTREGLPTQGRADALTRMFGTDEWQTAFYKPQPQQMGLFGGTSEVQRKQADFEQIGQFFLDRLGTVFAEVAKSPLIMTNSKNVPLYLFCFAAGNPKGAPTAVKIASNILGKANVRSF